MNNESAATLATTATLETFCTLSAQEMGEQILGTATETRVWLALEYPYPWGVKALPESALAEEVKAHLRGWEKSIPGARLQLIKQRSLPLRTAQVDVIPGQSIAFFVSLARETGSIAYRFRLQNFRDLMDIDLPALVAHCQAHGENGQAGTVDLGHAEPYTEPLFLVCTNGKRDRCCAKWGLPVYQAMRDYAGDGVWQTTHTGGHRFSATLVCLPEGAMYGWVEPADAAPLIDAHRAQQIYRLDRYRGRSCYAQPTQAADYYLRTRSGALGLSNYQLLNANSEAENQWQIAFQEAENGVVHQIALASRRSTVPFLGSCVKAPGYIDQFYAV